MSLFTTFKRRLPRLLRKYRVLIVAAMATSIFFFFQVVLFPQFEVPENLPSIKRATVALQTLPLFNRFREMLLNRELGSIDSRFDLRGPQPADPRIVVLAINDTSLKRANFRAEELEASEGLRLITDRDFTSAWNRKIYALLIDKLATAGARAIVFDLIFASENEGDADLRAAIARHPELVVLGMTTQKDAEGYLGVIVPNPSIIPPGVDDLQAYCFHNPDQDLAIRRVDYRTSLWRERGDTGYPSDLLGLAARAFEKATKQTAPSTEKTLINFQGRERTYAPLPLSEFFVDWIYATDPKFAGGAAFKDKIVFVGPTAEIFHDRLPTSVGEMPGVEVHAQILADLLAGKPLTESNSRWNLGVAFASVLLPALIGILIRQALIQFSLLLGLGAAFIVVAQIFFTEFRLVIPMVPPLFGLITVGSFGIVFHFVVEQLKGAHVRSVLDKFVSKNIAKVVIENSEDFETSLKGQRKAVTVLFSDVRGFTTIFETADPEKLVAQLNEYFLKMVDAVQDQGGTLQKFIGDAIMAVWGDTHSAGHAGDASRAVRSALCMSEALVRLNSWWADMPDRIQFGFGIGINHGEVIIGEIGHPDRMEFTALGDGINLAARLESATKQFHCEILVGEKAEELTRAEFVYRRVDLLRLKGKNRPVEVYIPLSDSTIAPPPWLLPYHQAIDLYRAREFDEAANRFRQINTELGGVDFLCQMYFARCQEFALTPPPPDWDGSFTLTEK